MIIKRIYVLLFCAFIVTSVYSKTEKIQRDKTLVKDGPGNFYDTISVLKVNSPVNNLGASKEDPVWIHIEFGGKKGYVSKLAFTASKSSSFDEPDFGDLSFDPSAEIAPASYTAAIKGFALDYSNKKGYSVDNIDDLMKITEFKPRDYRKTMRDTDLAYFPKNDGEYIGSKDLYINQQMRAFGLSASLSVLQNGVVLDEKMTAKLNVIANILNRQTWDYDIQYRVWIIEDSEPVAYSGPGGYVFLSNKLLEIITDYKELVAVIGHEIGHIAMRHGIKDLMVEQARKSAMDAFNELDADTLSEDELILSDELEEVADKALEACKLVRDDNQEYEADEVSVELLKRYKLDKKYLISALKKVEFALGDKYPRYKKQMSLRIKKLKKMK